MLRAGKDYRSVVRDFSWEIPPRFNIGRAVTEVAPAQSLALIEISGDGGRRDWRFGEILAAAHRLANGLSSLRARRGDRGGVLLSPSAACALRHRASDRPRSVAR